MEHAKVARGDTVFVPNYPRGESGDWVGGIVNSIQDDGSLLVGVKGHFSGASLVLATEYGTDWCLPENCEMPELNAERLR